METKHTPGPWEIEPSDDGQSHWIVPAASNGCGWVGDRYMRVSGPIDINDARLIAAAPELLESLRETVDLAWVEDSHSVSFDGTVMFSQYYDFDNLSRAGRQEFHGQYECIVWPGAKWSAYCTYDGSMWFEKFDTANEAKEACMRLLDHVLPTHPVMKARAAIAKATGSAA